MANLSLKPKLNLALQRASTTLRASAEGLKQGVADLQTATLTAPPTRHPVRRLLFALALPFTLLRLTLRDAEARALYARQVRGSLAVFFTVAGFFALHLVHLLPGVIDRPISRWTNALARLGTVVDVVSPIGDFETKREMLTMVTPRADRSPEQQEFVEEHAGDVADTMVPVLESLGRSSPPDRAGEDARVRAKLVSTLVNMSLVPDAGAPSTVPPLSSASSASLPPNEAPRREPAPPVRRMGFWAALLSIAAPLYLLEWICIWIFREHHDAISGQVYARFVGLAEPSATPARRPRLRFDLGHWGQKLWRAARFVFFVTSVEWVVLVPINVVTMTLQCVFQRDQLRGLYAAGYQTGRLAVLSDGTAPDRVATSAMGLFAASKPLTNIWFAINLHTAHVAIVLAALYWGAVFAIANGSPAWESPPVGWQPWYARLLGLYQRVPVLGWIARLYAWVLRFATRRVQGPAYAAEEAPIESLALLLGKAVIVVPGLYLLVRPFFGPAASHLLAARRGRGAPGWDVGGGRAAVGGRGSAESH